jgi:hypothetical protein
MTDTEIQQWHAKLRDHKNFQTMQAHLATVGVVTKKEKQLKVDISEFV